MRPVTKIYRLLVTTTAVFTLAAQQPPSPVDPSPINGETYYLINQLSGLQVDLNGNSTANGDKILQNTRSFSSLSQRWAMTKAPDGNWKISNIANGLCLDSVSRQGVVWTVQNPCGINIVTQEWSFSYVKNGYNAITNTGTNLVLDVAGSSTSAGAQLIQSPLSGNPTQSQQWLFRATYFRGNDSSLQEKAEFDRVAHPGPTVLWWHDSYLPGQDLLQIWKNHGMNMIRVRPASINTTVYYPTYPGTGAGDLIFPMTTAPYNHYTVDASVSQIIPATATGSAGQHAQTDWSAVDLCVRAKKLGMSCNVTLFYNGQNTSTVPGLWSGKTIAQVAGTAPDYTDGLMYQYVKQVMELFRAAGGWPDMVALGNEVNTGMFTSGITGGSCTPDGTGGGACFAPIQRSGMQAILDAASDTSNPAVLGPPLPPPLRCIHPDGGPDLQTFFNGAVNTNNIPIEVACESYYPGWHGPLTQAQANWHNQKNQHVAEVNMATQANGLGLPLFNIEDGVSYTTSGSPQDQWYVPPTRLLSRQAMIDLNKVHKNMPHNLSMGMEWWAGEATPIAGITSNERFWTTTGITLFDSSVVSGSALNNATLPVMLAMGGKLDPTLVYKFVSAANGRILETADASTAAGAALRTGLDTGVTGRHQQWQILAQGANPG